MTSIYLLKIYVICIGFLTISVSVFAQSQLLKNLSENKQQIVVVYGTSLSSGNNGNAWMKDVAKQLNEEYENRLVYHLSGKGGMWSTWGVQNLEDSVIKKNPNAVIIEFTINDAFHKYNTSVKLAKLNLEYMIKRIKIYDSQCEIILQIMNMPIGKSADYRPKLDEYCNMYREIAIKENLMLIDHYPNWLKILKKGKEEFLKYVPDGLHPNNLGAEKIIAPFIVKRLKEGIKN